jgi:hypothetical protein
LGNHRPLERDVLSKQFAEINEKGLEFQDVLVIHPGLNFALLIWPGGSENTFLS